MLIRFTTGHENFPDCGSKCHVFVVPSRSFLTPGHKEVHVAQAAKSELHCGVTRHGQTQRFPAAPGYRDEMGYWTEATYDVAPGVVLKVFGQRKGSHRNDAISASQFLRVRPGAPLIRLVSATTNHSIAQRNGAVIEGRFDLVTPEEAIQHEGARVDRRFLQQSRPALVDTIFTAEFLEPERAPAPIIETTAVVVDGREVQVTRQRPIRVLEFDDD